MGQGVDVEATTNTTNTAPRFVCDAMLGSLARWLRFFGFDCAFQPDVDDAELAEQARSERRWLLTRDRELAAVGPRSLLVRSGNLDDQLVEVFSRLGLQPEASLERSRCSACNGTVFEATLDEVRDRVPPYVAGTSERFRCCERCSRVYWRGTHSTRITRRMRHIRDRLTATA